MKIAVPVWEKKISPVLDAARSFLIIETNNESEVGRFEFKTKEGDVAALISHMKKNHIHVMICGALSRTLKNLIISSGVYVREGITGPVDSVLPLFIQKKPITADYIMPGFSRDKNMERKMLVPMNKEPARMDANKNDIDYFVEGLQSEIDLEVRELYGEVFYERWVNPLYQGEMENPGGHASITGSCGEIMDVFLKIENNTVVKASYTTNGCAPAQVCGSLAAELALDKPLEEAEKIDAKTIISLVNGLPKDKKHCAALAEKALKAAISQYKKGEP